MGGFGFKKLSFGFKKLSFGFKHERIYKVLGALGFINAWDLPIFGLFFVGAVFFKIYKDQGDSITEIVIRALPIFVIVFSATLLLYAPYYLYFQSLLKILIIIIYTLGYLMIKEDLVLLVIPMILDLSLIHI